MHLCWREILRHNQENQRQIYLLPIVFIFFYVSRRMYWFRANFRFPDFDGFIHFEMSRTRFYYFQKMSICLCVCDKKFMESVTQKVIP